PSSPACVPALESAAERAASHVREEGRSAAEDDRGRAPHRPARRAEPVPRRASRPLGGAVRRHRSRRPGAAAREPYQTLVRLRNRRRAARRLQRHPARTSPRCRLRSGLHHGAGRRHDHRKRRARRGRPHGARARSTAPRSRPRRRSSQLPAVAPAACVRRLPGGTFMRLRRLQIESFRGVKALDWRHIAETAALVGPGDSGKSTILDAIERVLSPKWNVSFDDTDFWDLHTEAPIVIRATITNLPSSFYRDSKFGLLLHGFDTTNGEAV